MQENVDKLKEIIVQKADDIVKTLKRGNDVEIIKTDHGIVIKQVSKKKL